MRPAELSIVQPESGERLAFERHAPPCSAHLRAHDLAKVCGRARGSVPPGVRRRMASARRLAGAATGFCPSCLGRRMTDTAVHLVEHMLPEVPARQWVCSLPWRLRYLCGYDRKLCAAVLGAFVGELSRSLRLRAKHLLGLRSVEQAHTGVVGAPLLVTTTRTSPIMQVCSPPAPCRRTVCRSSSAVSVRAAGARWHRPSTLPTRRSTTRRRRSSRPARRLRSATAR